MIKTLHPYSNTAKTAEIMSRYRPIAPKPETPGNSMTDGSSLCQNIKQSPYLRNLWPQLQARPTRTRKRGRASIPLLPSLKRQKTQVLGFCSPCHVTSPAKNLSLQSSSFTHSHSLPQRLPLPHSNHGVLNSGWEKPSNNTPSLVTLPLLSCSPTEPDIVKGREEIIDLNTTAEIPEEKDLLQQLQTPTVSIVVTPRPVRPLGSSISVGCINEDSSLPPAARTPKTPEEVELEVESEALPVVISDSNNRVRMANSAYKEMVGQPECPWLDSMVTSDGRIPCRSCKRISGEVTLRLCDSSVPISSSGFTCWVRIEWKTNEKISSLDAFCDVIRLCCESRDYLFKWRFHTRTTTREGSQSSCNV